ncbi:uncharacterized protein ACWYII_021804 isoform 2-T5 [Salvelinus alpinus]
MGLSTRFKTATHRPQAAGSDISKVLQPRLWLASSDPRAACGRAGGRVRTCWGPRADVLAAPVGEIKELREETLDFLVNMCTQRQRGEPYAVRHGGRGNHIAKTPAPGVSVAVLAHCELARGEILRWLEERRQEGRKGEGWRRVERHPLAPGDNHLYPHYPGPA